MVAAQGVCWLSGGTRMNFTHIIIFFSGSVTNPSLSLFLTLIKEMVTEKWWKKPMFCAMLEEVILQLWFPDSMRGREELALFSLGMTSWGFGFWGFGEDCTAEWIDVLEPTKERKNYWDMSTLAMCFFSQRQESTFTVWKSLSCWKTIGSLTDNTRWLIF